MAISTFGLRSYRVDMTAANTPRALFAATEQTAGHKFFVESFRVFSLSTNTGVFALGGPGVTVNTGLATDGEPLEAAEFSEWGVNPKVAAIPSEFDLRNIYITTTVLGDDFFVTYISKES